MAGSIRQSRQPGRWELRVSTGRDPVTGRYRTVSRVFEGTKRDAEKRLAKLVDDVAENRHLVADITVGQLLDRWLAHLEDPSLGDDGLAPLTVRGYRRIVEARLRPTFGRVPLRKLTTMMLDDYYRALRNDPERPLSVSSVRRIQSVASGALARAVAWGWLSQNPATGAFTGRRRKKKVNRDKVPTAAQVAVLITAAAASRRPEYATFLRVVAASGGRRGEVCGLRWTDVDLEAGAATIDESVYQLAGSVLGVKSTKTHADRTFALDSGTVAALKAHRAMVAERALAGGVGLREDAFVFSDELDGRLPWKPDTVTQFFTRLRDRCGLPSVVLHSLRHFHVTELRHANIPPAMVAERAGHADQATTAMYDHGRDATDQVAASAIGRVLDGP